MDKFKIGDRVRIKHNARREYGGWDEGDEGVIVGSGWKPNSYNIEEGGREFYNHVDDLELLSNKTIMSPIKQWVREARRGGPEKSFVKAGIMDENEQLTETGRDLVLEFFLMENKERFNTEIVQPYLKALEEKN